MIRCATCDAPLPEGARRLMLRGRLVEALSSLPPFGASFGKPGRGMSAGARNLLMMRVRALEHYRLAERSPHRSFERGSWGWRRTAEGEALVARFREEWMDGE